MNLLQEITMYGNAYWRGEISAETYYMLIDMAIEARKKEDGNDIS